MFICTSGETVIRPRGSPRFARHLCRMSNSASLSRSSWSCSSITRFIQAASAIALSLRTVSMRLSSSSPSSSPARNWRSASWAAQRRPRKEGLNARHVALRVNRGRGLTSSSCTCWALLFSWARYWRIKKWLEDKTRWRQQWGHLKKHMNFFVRRKWFPYPISDFFRLSSAFLLSSSILSSSQCWRIKASCSFLRRVVWERNDRHYI